MQAKGLDVSFIYCIYKESLNFQLILISKLLKLDCLVRECYD